MPALRLRSPLRRYFCMAMAMAMAITRRKSHQIQSFPSQSSSVFTLTFSTFSPFEVSGFKPFKFNKHKRASSDLVGSEKLNVETFDDQLKASDQQKMEMEKYTPCFEAQKKELPDFDVQNSLRQEILQLQEQLQSQFVIRHALEKAISFQPLEIDLASKNSIPKAATELINQIAVLELEVVYLEKYLLSLYRSTFKQQSPSSPTVDERSESYSGQHIVMEGENSVTHSCSSESTKNSVGDQLKGSSAREPRKQLYSNVPRSYSSLSQTSACSSGNCPLSNSMAKAIDSYHSLPLSMLEQSRNVASNSVSLQEHLDAHKSPNWLSEEMIKSISAIYCELAETPMINPNSPSPISSTSSVYGLSLDDYGSTRNYEKFSTSNLHFDNPLHIVNSEEPSGPYCTMLKVQWISRERMKEADISHKLQNFRSLVYHLREVDLEEMKHEEKLAFWINVHNTLVMHAYLQYGIPKNNLKRISVLLKAAYNVGGHIISIDMIQSLIFGCRLPRSGQWLRLFFHSKTKFKCDGVRKALAIDRPEPRLYFALCCGSHSDPAVRIYTPKGVHDELEVAKEDFILSNISQKGQKYCLPKIVESFAKDSGLRLQDLVKLVGHLKPDGEVNNIQQCQNSSTWKSLGWIPHNATFSFLLSKELACRSAS